MPDIIQSAVRRAPEARSLILVLGKTGAGKTTFIDACTSENYLRRYQSDSSKSHTSRTYSVDGLGGLRRQCFFHEEPSFLENVTTSSRLFFDFASFLLSEDGEHVAGIVYVLNLEQEVLNQRTQNSKSLGLAFKSHLEFVQSWIGSACLQSAVLTKNRPAVGQQASQISEKIDSIWNSVLRHQSLGIKDDNPNDVVKSLMDSSTSLLQLRNEIFKEKKQLRKTEIGQLYIKQLKIWIDEAKIERKSIKKAKGDISAVDQNIAMLKMHLHTWKKLQYPHIESKRQREKARRSGY